MNSNQEILILNIILRNAITKNNPTPTETAIIVIFSGIAEIWLAKIFKSGSAKVMIVPSINSIIKMDSIFLFLAIFAPTLSPITDIETSAPSVNSPIPTISKAAPTKNWEIISTGNGVIVNDNAIIISETGKIEDSDSRIFNLIFSFNSKHSLSFVNSLIFFLLYTNSITFIYEIIKKKRTRFSSDS